MVQKLSAEQEELKFLIENEQKVSVVEEVEFTHYEHKKTGERTSVVSIYYTNLNGEREHGYYIKEGSGYSIVDIEYQKELRERWKKIKTTKENIEKYKDKAKERGFVQFDREKGKELEYTLSPAERNYYAMLIPYIQFNGNPLYKKGIGKLTIVEIAEIWDLDTKQAGKHIRKFVKLGIVKTVQNPKNKRYPFYATTGIYFLKGEWENLDDFTVKTYQDTMEIVIERLKIIVKKHLKANPTSKAIYPLSVLNAITPYVHFETSYVLDNYDSSILLPLETINDALERDPNVIKHMKFTEIRRKAAGKEIKEGEKIEGRKANQGLHTNTLNQYFDWLEEVGAIAFFGPRKNKKLLVHPDLVYISPNVKDDAWIRTIKNLFKQGLR